MSIKRTVLFTCLCFATIIVGCRKEAFDAYYGRPKGLASPIYQQLDSMGDFTYFLSCIEKAGYRNTLGSASSWTVFAPTDRDRKSTRLNSSHVKISYAVFCLKKKK